MTTALLAHRASIGHRADPPWRWIFWRWGLPYAMLSHMAVNAVHLALQSRIF